MLLLDQLLQSIVLPFSSTAAAFRLPRAPCRVPCGFGRAESALGPTRARRQCRRELEHRLAVRAYLVVFASRSQEAAAAQLPSQDLEIAAVQARVVGLGDDLAQ